MKAIKIKHLLDENEKVSIFNNEESFISFVRMIMFENGDNFETDTFAQAEHYIVKYCDNLQIL